MSELNPYSEIWSLRHNAEIWGHRANSSLPRKEHSEKQRRKGEGFATQSECVAMKMRGMQATPPIARLPLKYYDRDEIFAALLDLSKGEMNRLTRLARCIVRNTARAGYVEAEDLFMDATVRTLKQTRRWKRTVSRFDHLVGVMRSIAHQRLKQSSRYVTLNELIAAPQSWDVSAADAQTIIVCLKEQLSADGIALSVLESMADEMGPRNAQLCLGISDKVYWAARKRIRRLAENLPGVPHRQRK